MRQQFYVTYWRSQFSGRVSAIEARDDAIFTLISISLFFIFFNSPKMKNELEKVHGSDPQDTVDAANGDTPSRGMFEGFERSESSKGYQSQRGRRQASCEDESEDRNLSNSSNSSNPLEQDEFAERVRRACRRSCRRNFWIELLKTAGKIAGVILAAFGLSSFNEEN